MLWKTLAAALETFLYWEIYAATAVYLILTFGPVLLFASIGRAAGVGLMFFVQPFFRAFGIMAFVSIVAPIALGISDEAAWHLPWKFVTEAPLDVAKYSFQIVLVSFALAFFPLLGGLPSFTTLVLGIFATKMVFNLAGVEGISRSDLIPSFWVSFGILVLGAAVSILGTLVATLVSSIVAAIFSRNGEEVSSLVALLVVATFGFAPLLVYLSWLRITLS